MACRVYFQTLAKIIHVADIVPRPNNPGALNKSDAIYGECP